MGEWRLFAEGAVPEWTTAAWYEHRPRARHLEEGHRGRLQHCAECVRWCVKEGGARSVVDLGCGDGGLLSLLPDRTELPPESLWGYDISPAAVSGAVEDRGVQAELLDFVADEPRWADVVILTETLEHLVDPHAMLRRVRQHARFVVASSPQHETADSHYGFHTWAWDLEGYRAMFEGAGWRVRSQGPVDWFQVLLAEAA